MAISGRLTVTPEALRAQSNAVESARGTMQNHFSDLRTLIEGSKGYWVGDAGEAHRNLYLTRIDKVDEMLRRYQEHVKDLQIMAGVYETAEKSATGQGESLPVSTLD